ncbi:MAG: hypothetical protein JWO53_894 [Chlamydiia bacterium]|nr:hypothetical protein [Chlamydiia bacterium]
MLANVSGVINAVIHSAGGYAVGTRFDKRRELLSYFGQVEGHVAKTEMANNALGAETRRTKISRVCGTALTKIGYALVTSSGFITNLRSFITIESPINKEQQSSSYWSSSPTKEKEPESLFATLDCATVGALTMIVGLAAISAGAKLHNYRNQVLVAAVQEQERSL